MATTITVYVESEPHTEDLSAVLLNRPAPQGGSFMISMRLERAIWNQMKAAGAWYFSADELEDLDMFLSEPGWRYSGAAMEVLLRNGYELNLRGETITTVEQFRALWTDESKAAYRARIAAEQAAAEQAAREKKAAAEQERHARGAAYAAWVQEHTAGLVSTSIGPDASARQYGAGGPWELVYHAEKGTPGAWHDTGDRWYQNPTGVLRRDYGNASLWFASQDVVDSWVLACDSGTAAYARHVLEYHNYGVVGSDVADRLVELRGLDHYLELAKSEEWLIRAGNYSSRTIDTIAHYGIVSTPIAIRPFDYSTHRALVTQLRAALGLARENPPREYTGVGQAGDGRWFATSDVYNGGDWRKITAEQCVALGLDTTPPAVAPTMPEARPLPTRDETDERSRRFSEMFSG